MGMQNTQTYSPVPDRLLEDVFKVPGPCDLTERSRYTAILLPLLPGLPAIWQQLVFLHYYGRLSVNAVSTLTTYTPSRVRRELAMFLHVVRLACNPAYGKMLESARAKLGV